jgi:hypothetical protein
LFDLRRARWAKLTAAVASLAELVEELGAADQPEGRQALFGTAGGREFLLDWTLSDGRLTTLIGLATQLAVGDPVRELVLPLMERDT